MPKSKADCLDARTPKAACTHVLRTEFSGREMVAGRGNPTHSSACMSTDANACGNVSRIAAEYGGWFQLAYAAFHCHAPGCILGELWNRDTGTLICRNTALYGEGDEVLNERAYVVGIPPCVWGSVVEGLLPPPRIHLDTNLTGIKHCNSTNAHWGVMGMWQGRATYLH